MSFEGTWGGRRAGAGESAQYIVNGYLARANGHVDHCQAFMAEVAWVVFLYVMRRESYTQYMV